MGIEELINRGRKGDEKALNHLYNTYSHKMKRICAKIVGNHMIAEELAHDAFILAIAKLDQLQNPRRFSSWLSTITSNVALRYLEQNNGPHIIPLSELSDDDINLSAEEDTPGKVLPPFEVLMAAIDNLPKGYGKVFKMSVIQEMTHAEIAEILGIAAHSSSSQLARAKKMLRKSLSSYWSFILALLLGSSITYFIFRHLQKEPSAQPIASSNENDTKNELTTDSIKNKVDTINVATNISSTPYETRGATAIQNSITTDSTTNHYTQDFQSTNISTELAVSSVTSIPKDSVENASKVEQSTDTIIIDSLSTPKAMPQPTFEINRETYIAQQEELDIPIKKESHSSKWNLNLAYSGALGDAKDNAPSNWWTDKNHSNTHPDGINMKYNFNYWSDFILYADNALIPNNEKEAIKKVANRNIIQGKNKIVHSSHHHFPISATLSLQYRLNDRLGIESGLSYTLLASQFVSGTEQDGIVEKQKIHYLGIPLKFSFNWLNTKHWNIYSSAGIAFEIPVNTSFSTNYQLRTISLFNESQSLEAPLQWSTSISVGAQYNITPSIGFFVEPNATYFIPCNSEIETYRTQYPFSATIPIGLRIRW